MVKSQILRLQLHHNLFIFCHQQRRVQNRRKKQTIADYQVGGQKMLDIIEFDKALQISWILKYISNDCKSKWKCFFDFHLSKVGGKLVVLGNLAPKDAIKIYVKGDFIQELIELWTNLNYRDSFASQAKFCGSHIWNNSMIRIAGKTIFLTLG